MRLAYRLDRIRRGIIVRGSHVTRQALLILHLEICCKPQLSMKRSGYLSRTRSHAAAQICFQRRATSQWYRAYEHFMYISCTAPHLPPSESGMQHPSYSPQPAATSSKARTRQRGRIGTRILDPSACLGSWQRAHSLRVSPHVCHPGAELSPSPPCRIR